MFFESLDGVHFENLISMYKSNTVQEFHSGDAISRAINSDVPLIIDPFSFKIREPNQKVKHHFIKAKVDKWQNKWPSACIGEAKIVLL